MVGVLALINQWDPMGRLTSHKKKKVVVVVLPLDVWFRSKVLRELGWPTSHADSRCET